MGQRWAGAAGASARLAPLQFSLLSARGEQSGWHVRISRRARRLTMRVYPGGRVEVVVPPGSVYLRSSGSSRGIATGRSVARVNCCGGARRWSEARARGTRRARADLGVEYVPGRVRLPSESRKLPSGWRTRRTGCRRAPLLSWLASAQRQYCRQLLATLAFEIGIDYRMNIAPAAHTLGQLLSERHDQPERLPDVPATRSRRTCWSTSFVTGGT